MSLALSILGATTVLAGFALLFANAARVRRTQRASLSRRWASIACLLIGAATLQATAAQRDAENRQATAIDRQQLRQDLAKAEQQLIRNERELAALKAEAQEADAR